MKSVGESMAIGRNFKRVYSESIVFTREIGLDGFDNIDINENVLIEKLKENTPQKILYVAQAFRQKFSRRTIYNLTKLTLGF